jgi:hypothetical protein
VQDEFLVFHHQGVAGVVTSLKSDDVVGGLTQEIDNLTLALVAPLCVFLPQLRLPWGKPLYVWRIGVMGKWSVGVLVLAAF